LRSPDTAVIHRAPVQPLVAKELWEIASGRALWSMLLILCPLVGYSFFQAVSLYGEASAAAVDSPVLGSGLSPLDGVLVPTFGGLYLVATLLFPFVLAELREPLIITVHLAPEDPRYVDLRCNVLSKLERVMARVTIRLATSGQSMVGSASEEAYGEVEYTYDGRINKSRSTSHREILPLIYALAQRPIPADRRRGLSRLSAARQRLACARLVSRRPAGADRSCMVAQSPPPATHRTPDQNRRSSMKTSKHTASIALASLCLAALLAYAHAGQSSKIDFSDETVGAEPKSFVSVVGVWRIENDGNNKVLVVDGQQWKEGQTAAGIADKARALYGDRYAEFLDRVQAYAYFPYVVTKDVTDFRDGEISVRFEGISGRIDQGAGILFNLKPNGD